MKKLSSSSNWASLLASALVSKIDDVPPDWKTCEALAKQHNMSESRMRQKLKALLRDGSIEMRKYVIATGLRNYATPHYRMK